MLVMQKNQLETLRIDYDLRAKELRFEQEHANLQSKLRQMMAFQTEAKDAGDRRVQLQASEQLH